MKAHWAGPVRGGRKARKGAKTLTKNLLDSSGWTVIAWGMMSEGGRHESNLALPERLYTLPVAAELIPMPTVRALEVFLSRHKSEFTPRYRKTRWYEQRLLTESDILKIREMTVFGAERSRYHTPGYLAARRTRSAAPPLARILRMANAAI